jgi:hypothetical protein
MARLGDRFFSTLATKRRAETRNQGERTNHPEQLVNAGYEGPRQAKISRTHQCVAGNAGTKAETGMVTRCAKQAPARPERCNR